MNVEDRPISYSEMHVMEDGDAQFIGIQLWKQLYEAAFFELDPMLLPQKIADAQKAIGERALALFLDQGHNHSEKEALARAYFTLDDLKINHQTDRALKEVQERAA